jgi:hypothetical protein
MERANGAMVGAKRQLDQGHSCVGTGRERVLLVSAVVAFVAMSSDDPAVGIFDKLQ